MPPFSGGFSFRVKKEVTLESIEEVHNTQANLEVHSPFLVITKQNLFI